MHTRNFFQQETLRRVELSCPDYTGDESDFDYVLFLCIFEFIQFQRVRVSPLQDSPGKPHLPEAI
ncbi:hypothetical protein O5478_18170 [Escherichia coli]|nr:hypothetical protein [Escherichia coli]